MCLGASNERMMMRVLTCHTSICFFKTLCRHQQQKSRGTAQAAELRTTWQNIVQACHRTISPLIYSAGARRHAFVRCRRHMYQGRVPVEAVLGVLAGSPFADASRST